jgi:hypothetical protein
MEKRFAFATLLILTVLVGTVGFVSADYNVLPSVSPSLPGTTYKFTLKEEGYYFFTPSVLTSLTVADDYHMTLSTRVRVTIIVADCCVMGDTIVLLRPLTTTLALAKSPNIIEVTFTLNAGTYDYYVGYRAAPGGFPEGYYVWFIATHV